MIPFLLAVAVIEPIRTHSNVPAEVVFQAARPHADPFNDVTVDVLFTDPLGNPFRVPAFWAGGTTWKARYASPRTGIHRYQTVCSDPTDAGLNGIKGEVRVDAYHGKNPLYRHGPLIISPDRRNFRHADGTPFFWLADTWWMGLAERLHWPDEFKTLTDDRVKKGFNVVQIVAGLYPDSDAFDPRGKNEAGFPWEPDYKRINPAYFDRADERIRHLVDQGLMPCVFGAWGYHLPWLGTEKMKRHWRYLVARYGAYPVVWSVAGEANLPWYLAPGFPNYPVEQVHGWTDVARYLRETDPYRRLRTIHPTAVKYFTSRNAIDDVGLLDFDMLQTPHGEQSAAEITVRQVRESYAAKPTMPVIDGEAAYEMLNDKLPTAWVRAMFWVSLLNGASGHTYGANGIWQNNRPGDPHGKSPHGGSYGSITWQDAMKLPGSEQMGIAKRLFEKYQWWDFEPHPDWASYQTNSENPTLGPQCAGIPMDVRLHYMQRPLPVTLQSLGIESRYTAKLFDPVTGQITKLPNLKADTNGRAPCAPPAGYDHDWVLILEPM